MEERNIGAVGAGLIGAGSQKMTRALQEAVARYEDPSTVLMKKIAKNTTQQEYLASAYVDRLTKYINKFNAELDDEHEVGITMVSFGQSVTMHVEDVGYYNPGLVCFYGYLISDGSKAQLVQHISQINLFFAAVKRDDPTKPKRMIGFRETEECSAEEQTAE